jgi:RES domain-containing protein
VIAFRIASRRHRIFDGAGAAEFGGRWNSPGRPVIYAATSLSLAMLEQLAQTGTGRLPTDHVCIEITIPDVIAIEIANASDIPGWDATDRRASRAFGDRWLTELRSSVLLIPSVIVPSEQNVAINPAHVDFGRIDVSGARPLNWDGRLKKYVEGRRI